MKQFFRKYICDKAFYRMLLAVALPIMLQNGVTNFVSLLDNIMVGKLGTNPMSGVAIVNQLMFVFNITVFGAMSGPGIFTAQFYGSKDTEGIRRTFRFKFILALIIGAGSVLLFQLAGSGLISLYLKGEGLPADIEATLGHAKDYLAIMMIGLAPFAVTQAYATTMREVKRTVPPMVSSLIAVAVNLSLNYVLIYGHFGMPALGIRGAAIATVISRFVECFILVLWTHMAHRLNPFIEGAFRHFYIPVVLIRNMLFKCVVFLSNELLWAGGVTTLVQLYCRRGLIVVGAMNITNTINDLLNVVFLALGSAISILLGHMLGADKKQEAKIAARKMVVFSTAVSVAVGAVMAGLAFVFPLIYNTTAEIRALARQLMLVCAYCMPLWGITNAAYFTLRSGGNALLTFASDSAFMWVISIPLVYVLVRFTGLPILTIFALCKLSEILKALFGIIFINTPYWMTSVVRKNSQDKLSNADQSC